MYAEIFFSEPQTVNDAHELTEIENEYCEIKKYIDGLVEVVYDLYNPYSYVVRLVVNDIVYAFPENAITRYSVTPDQPGIHIISVRFFK